MKLCKVLSHVPKQPPLRGFVRQEQGKGEGSTAEANWLSTPNSTVEHRVQLRVRGAVRVIGLRGIFSGLLCARHLVWRGKREWAGGVSLLVRGTIQRALSLLDIFVSHGRLRANFLVFLPHSLLEHTPLSSHPPIHLLTTTTSHPPQWSTPTATPPTARLSCTSHPANTTTIMVQLAGRYS